MARRPFRPYLSFPVNLDEDRTIIGLDPGRSGGVAIITVPKWNSFAWGLATLDRKDVAELFRYLSACRPTVAFLEAVGARPGQDCRASFSFGMAYERLSWAECFDIPIRTVRPQDWQKAIGAPKAPADKTIKAHKRKQIHKNDLKNMAQRIFPKLKVTLQTADALLLAHYGAQTMVLEKGESWFRT